MLFLSFFDNNLTLMSLLIIMQNQETLENIITICNKRPGERNPSEILTLADFSKSCKVFQNLIQTNGLAFYHKCCKYLKHQFCPQNQYLIKYGEQGTRFYIIISGLVGVEVPRKNKKGENFFVEVSELGDGLDFGELALESSKPRGASIKCKVNSHFMYLEKNDYVQLVSKIVQDKRTVLVNFLHSLPMFKNCTKGTLAKLTYFLKEKVYKKGQIVYYEGDSANDLFFIREGEFEFYKIIRKNSKKTKNYELNKKKVKNMKIANFGIGEMFGEEDSLKNTNRITTCKCVSSSSLVFSVPKTVFFIQDFVKQVIQEDIIQYLSHKIQEKLESFDKRTKMLTFIENDDAKQPIHNRKKTLLCLDFENMNELPSMIYRSKSSICVRDSQKRSPIKTEILKNNTNLTKSDLIVNKTEREEKKNLPVISKFLHKRSGSDLLFVKKYLPSSLNQENFKYSTGFSIFSMNGLHLNKCVKGKT